jgi:site-specific DNA-cytosine methylase
LTYTVNRDYEKVPNSQTPRTLFIQSDLSRLEERAGTYAAIKEKLAGGGVSALVGGPPCQGFSHAGFRSRNDARNDLAVAFMDFVAELRPQSVVLENVEGLMSYRGGQTIRELALTLRDLGYTVGNPWLLAAEQFGVPQMRRRVFLVGNLGSEIETPSPAYARCLGRREPRGVMPDTDGLPYPVTVEEAFLGLPQLSVVSHPGIGYREVRHDYSAWLNR